jgi:uncharacterized protein involved in cysteine biosynthesis
MNGTRHLKEQLSRELGPIAMHMLVVLLIESSLLVIGLATKWLEHVLPEQSDHLIWVERLDALTAFILLALFASYTITLVAIRLWVSLAKEVRGGAP